LNWNGTHKIDTSEDLLFNACITVTASLSSRTTESFTMANAKGKIKKQID
jgi:hypothetical protein